MSNPRLRRRHRNDKKRALWKRAGMDLGYRSLRRTTDVSDGSIASIWRCQSYFRFSPDSRPSSEGSTSPKSGQKTEVSPLAQQVRCTPQKQTSMGRLVCRLCAPTRDLCIPRLAASFDQFVSLGDQGRRHRKAEPFWRS
jgi:hypothetical protein